MDKAVVYVKNPIVVGIITAAVTYGYLWYSNEQRHKQDPEARKKRVNIMIPAVIGALAWFIISVYTENKTSIIRLPESTGPTQIETGLGSGKSRPSTGPAGVAGASGTNPVANANVPAPSLVPSDISVSKPTINFDDSLVAGLAGGGIDLHPTGSPEIGSFEMIRKRNIKIPAPDVFLDIGEFN